MRNSSHVPVSPLHPCMASSSSTGPGSVMVLHTMVMVLHTTIVIVLHTPGGLEMYGEIVHGGDLLDGGSHGGDGTPPWPGEYLHHRDNVLNTWQDMMGGWGVEYEGTCTLLNPGLTRPYPLPLSFLWLVNYWPHLAFGNVGLGSDETSEGSRM